MTLALYKLVKALTNLAIVGLGFYAISEGGDPTLTIAVVGAVIGGWEVLEVLAVHYDSVREMRDDVEEIAPDGGDKRD